MIFTIIQWFTVFLSLLGNYFVNKQNKIGLIICLSLVKDRGEILLSVILLFVYMFSVFFIV